jgi:hypothetical protein
LNARPRIVSQICESMIRMSHASLLVFVAAAGVSGLLGGCCGGAPSHKCDFSGLPGHDAGTDGPTPCANLPACTMGTVCCLTKIAPFAACIPPSQFQQDNCETKPPPATMCQKPSDCDGGTVCCLSPNAGMIACEPSGLCPGGGASGTYLVCSTDNDCPSRAPGACMALPIPVDAGISLSYCP